MVSGKSERIKRWENVLSSSERLSNRSVTQSNAESIRIISEILLNTSPIELFCMYASRMALIGLHGIYGKEEVDEEFPMSRAHLEFLIDFALTLPYPKIQRRPTTEEFLLVVHSANCIFTNLENLVWGPPTEEDMKLRNFQNRNKKAPFEDAFHIHKKEVLLAYVTYCDAEILNAVGFSGISFFKLMEKIISRLDLNREFLEVPIEQIGYFDIHTGSRKGEPTQTGWLRSPSEGYQIFPESEEEVAILSSLGIDWKEGNTGLTIVDRPFLKIGPGYFAPNPLIVLFRADRLIEDLMVKDSPQWEKFAKKRGEWLEEYAAQTLTTVFHPSKVRVFSKLTIEPQLHSAKVVDGIVDLMEYNILLESKTGRFHSLSWKGHDRVLHKGLGKLFEEAAIQTDEFIKMAKNSKVKVLSTMPDSSKVAIQIREEIPILRLGICLEPVGKYVTGQMNRNFDQNNVLGFVCMNIYDLQLVCTVLNDPITILHYLIKRSLYSRLNAESIDEVELLGLYTSIGIPPRHSSGELNDGRQFNMAYLDWRSRLERFLHGVGDRPGRRFSKRVNQLLNRIKLQQPEHYLEFGFFLLELDFETERQLELALRSINKNSKFDSTFEGKAVFGVGKSLVVIGPGQSLDAAQVSSNLKETMPDSPFPQVVLQLCWNAELSLNEAKLSIIKMIKDSECNSYNTFPSGWGCNINPL